MSSEEHKIDVRKAGQSIGNKSVDQRYSANMDRTKMKTLQASVILAIASFGASAESIQIFVSSNLQQPTGDLSGSDNVFPPGIVFSGAAAEAAVFLTGLFLSVASAFFDINNPKLTGVALITTLILAWYYFITLVVAQPVSALTPVVIREAISVTPFQHKNIIRLYYYFPGVQLGQRFNAPNPSGRGLGH